MKNGFVKNTTWIFFGNITRAILGFALAIFTARCLTTDEYGLLNYVTSLVAFFASFTALGIDGIITKKFAEAEEEASEYLSTGIILRMVTSLIVTVPLIVYSFIANNEPILIYILILECIKMFFSSFDLFMYWFRYDYDAKFVVITRFIGFFSAAIVKMVALFIYHDVIYYSIGVVVEFGVIALSLYKGYKRKHSFSFTFHKSKAISMLKISYPFILSAIMVSVYAYTDKIMLRSMIDNTSVAMYSVAMTLAGAFSIIPVALIEAFRPEIMRYKGVVEELYKKRLRQLYGITFWTCAFYCTFITVFSEFIILNLYGDRYSAAIPALSLVVWYSTFSYFGGINNLYLIAEYKTKWVQVLTILGAVVNVSLNFMLIPRYGTVGAGLASLLTQFIANFLSFIVIKQLRDNFYNMLYGICCINIDLPLIINFIKQKIIK